MNRSIAFVVSLVVVFVLAAVMCLSTVHAATEKTLNTRMQLRPVNWPSNQLLWFAPGSYWIDSSEMGVQSGTLDQTSSMRPWNSKNTIDFTKGFIRFERAGGVKEGVLARDMTLCVTSTASSNKASINFMGGRSVEFGYDGCVMKGSIAQDMTLQTPSGSKTLSKGTIVEFDAGKVTRFSPAQ
jgi:hypothetical protein